ncbi:branched-chain amino acid ABC transporter permease [Blastococcus sp. SYSU DS0533]
MSDLTAARRGPRPVAVPQTWTRSGRAFRLALVLLLVLLPFVADVALLQTGTFVFASVIAVIGLNLLSGSAGQLSLGHAVFVAIGAYAYSHYAGSPEGELGGWQLPPLLAMVLACLTAGLAGLLFSPVASRLKGLSLGVASVSLIFIGTFALTKIPSVTGGFNGRDVETFSVFGFSFGDDEPFLYVAGVEFTSYHRLWFLGLVLAVLAYVFARRVLAGRMGRAFEAVRDGEVSAAVAGIDVRRTKATAFVLSSIYAGLGGVLLALSVSHVVPETFTLTLALNYLAAIVIGGLGSVGGGVAGAVFVFALPQMLNQYGGDVLPFVSMDPGYLAQYIYGFAVILVLLFEPDGLAAILERVRRQSRRRPPDTEPSTPAAAREPTASVAPVGSRT